jgi:Phosphoenolpyruvate carboxykinase
MIGWPLYVAHLPVTPYVPADRSQVANPSVSALYEDALVYETGSAMTSTGALTAYSGAKTGRSPLDKRVVKEEGSEKDVWWGPVNKPMSPDVSRNVFVHMPLEKKPSFESPFVIRCHPVSKSRLPRSFRSRILSALLHFTCYFSTASWHHSSLTDIYLPFRYGRSIVNEP